jgi:glycosyltransferase involved in cell wall biosynthesis
MVARRPESVTEIIAVGPGGVDTDLKQFDRVIVSGMYGFSDRELNTLTDLNPIVWVHDTQFSGHWLLEAASTVILLTPGHKDFEMSKSPLLREDHIVLNPGWFETKFLQPCRHKDANLALWAHRPEPHKGLDRAVEWAKQRGIKLEVMVGRPQGEVFMAMCRCRYFVLLSHIFDPGPRSVMEAQISGCELIIDNVGYWDEEGEVLAARIRNADKAFWEVVMA